MKENYTIARPYAQAVFDLAREEGDLGTWSNMLRLISMVVSDPQMPLVLENPKLDSNFQANFILDICGEHLSATGKKYVRVLVNSGRLSQAAAIYRLFEEYRHEEEKVVDVEVTSAYPLDDQEKDRIGSVMEKRFGRKINISTRVDESLIGGSIIRTGDFVIDASVKGSLRQLSNRITD